MLHALVSRALRDLPARVRIQTLEGLRSELAASPERMHSTGGACPELDRLGSRYVSSSAQQAVEDVAEQVSERGEAGGVRELLRVLSQIAESKDQELQEDVELKFDLQPSPSFFPSGESQRRINGAGVSARPDPRAEDMGDEYWKAKYAQQIEFEQMALYEALEKYKKELDSAKKREMVAAMPRARRLLLKWFEPLVVSIRSEQQRLLDEHSHARVAPFFILLEPEELAVLTMHVVVGTLIKGERGEGGRARLVKVASSLGRCVQSQVNLLRLKHKSQQENRRKNQLNRYLEKFKKGEADIAQIEEEVPELKSWEKKMLHSAIELDKKLRVLRNKWSKKGVSVKDVTLAKRRLAEEYSDWGSSICAQLGAKLIELLKGVAKIEVSAGHEGRKKKVDALHHELIWRRNGTKMQLLGMLSVHPNVINAIESSGFHSSIALERALPMVYPPRKWSGFRDGGYLSLQSMVMRVKGSKEQMELLRLADEKNEMRRVYKALNVLGNTPWQINKEVLEVIEEVWRRGGGMLDLPSQQDVSYPQLGEDRFRLCTRDGALYATYAGEAFIETMARKEATRKARKKNREMYSLRSDFNLKLSVARRFLKEDKVFFPHNMDFRGRAYPIPPHLNHLGSDVARAMLQFADAKPLGEKGLYWLYVQVANLYGSGADKLPLEDRHEFGFSHMDQILDSANKPLDGLQWWMNADEPWQLLATCKEIRDAMAHGEPAQFPSRMHVHQDGSCNGLQHYAALGRDSIGGLAVNLLPTDGPQDVYTRIAQIVSRRVEEDAKKGLRQAEILTGNVDRKLVKQTVMTSVYGVTFIGAREQIANRLRERGWDDDETIYRVSAYAASVTLDGLHEMFQSAKYIMKWLSDCAQLIAKTGKTVVWKTPLGLPVMQPYRKLDTMSVKTVLQHLTLVHQTPNSPVLKQRQRSAFPPNYVHSLDSTHMMMTANACHSAGLAFAGVHDSFWTHAATVDHMNEILREKFLELHNLPLLENLKADFERHFPEVGNFPPVPEMGDLNLQEIRKSTYFFS